MGVRTKKYYTGDYLEIEVFNVSKKKKPVSRARKVKESSPAQKNLNDKRRKRYFVRLVNSNFRKGDLTIELTYSNEHLPEDRDEMRRDIRNFIARVKRRFKKQFPDRAFKYIYVIPKCSVDGSGSKARPHFHMFLTGGLDRDLIEELWGKGYANTDRIKFTEVGATGKAIYMADQARSERSWSGSQNLIKPEPVVSDKAITASQMDRIINDPSDGRYIEKLINGRNKTRYTFTDCIVENDGRQLNLFGLEGQDMDEGDGIGFSLLIRMRKEH